MKRNCILWVGIILAISLVIVPALLNWILQWHVPVCMGIIGEEDAPRVWLAFWGAFLAAIGSIIMAVITFFTAREDRRQDYLKHEIDHLRADYSIIEKEIQENEIIHSITYYDILFHDAPENLKDEKDRRNYALNLWHLNLRKSSSGAIKFDYYDYSGEYINALKAINTHYLNFIALLKTRNIVEGTEFNVQDEAPEVLKSGKLYGDLFDAGFELLKNFHSKIKEKHDGLKSKSL